MGTQFQELTDLLRQRGEQLYATLARITLRPDVAEDLLQDLFLRLARSEGFRRADNQAAYAQSAAIHLAFDWRRQLGRRDVQRLTDEPMADHRSALDGLVAAESINEILLAMDSLNESDREILVLRYLEQEDYMRIAELRGTSTHHARSQCHRAMNKLRAKMDMLPEPHHQETRRADA